MRPGSIRAAPAFLLISLALVASGSGAARPSVRATVGAIARAERVPADLLLTLGRLNTRWQVPAKASIDGGYGPMDLTAGELRRAARLGGVDPRLARRDLRENVRAAAVLLAQAHRGRTWYETVARIWNTPLAQEVAQQLGYALPRRLAAVTAGSADYPGARWLAASRADYAVSNRPISNPITMIVIHTTDGSYAGTLSWFRNPEAQASAHYVIRSSDGQITQMVHEKDEAWHAGNGAVNATAIGIEHEAYTNNCAWYTDAMYRSSAQLSAYLVTKYLIPADRRHIIGHYQVPDPNHPGEFGGFAHHTDPGPCWNWPEYMALVRNFAGASLTTVRQTIADDSARGFTVPRGWRRTTSAGAYARSFLVAGPRARADVRFRLRIPVAGLYAVYGWWPASAKRSRSVAVGVDTSGGRQWLKVDQRRGDDWKYLGSYVLSGKQAGVVFSPKTHGSGTIAADAVKAELLAPPTGSGLEDGGHGWATTTRRLSATTDGGSSWRSLSPPGVAVEQIRGSRLDGPSASLVVATGNPKQPLSLYRTSNAGASWVARPLRVPADVDIAAQASISAPDAEHELIAVRLQPSRWSLSRGVLLSSGDGGATWTSTALPAGGEVSFVTSLDGWLVGGLARERLYATYNGGATWSRVRPASPIKSAASTAYSLPTFSSPTDGVLPVSLAAGARSTLAFETTTDGGRSWARAALVHVGKALRIASAVPTAVVSPTFWLAASGTDLVAVADDGTGSVLTTVGTLPGAVSQLHFASADVGWAEVPRTCTAAAVACPAKLYATADGGATWTRLRPP